MIAQTELANCPLFTLHLQAHTHKKRTREAKHALAALYPFEISEENIFITKTAQKGQYNVYITKASLQKKLNIKKICIITLPALFVALLFTLIIHYTAQKKLKTVSAQKELEKQQQETRQIQKEKETTLANLQKEYIELKALEYEKIYPALERIYSAITEKSTIETISIEKNIFSVSVTTKDAVNILSNFEQSTAFNSVKMNRTTVKDGTETVTYNGEFSRFLEEAAESISIDEKIEFYKTRIAKSMKRSETMKTRALSEYIKHIRTTLRNNTCSEQYIQLTGKSDNAEVEFFILSTSRNILNCIKELQEGSNNFIDIKSFRLRNSENRNRIQTTICFDTGIELQKDNAQFSEYINKPIELSEIDKIFYKSPAPKASSPKPSLAQRTTNNQKIAQKTIAVPRKNLSFVGLTKNNGNDYVIAKDDDMGSIYKLIICESEISEDCCVKNSNGYTAKIRGEYYEVKK